MIKKDKRRLDLADKLSFFHSILTEEKNSGFSRPHNMLHVFKEDLMKKTSRMTQSLEETDFCLLPLIK